MLTRSPFAISAGMLLGLLSPGTAAETPPARPPNVILIVTDDLGYGDLACYGGTGVDTPNIDRLARGGRLFHHAYATSSTCTPTRYAIMTGEYPWRQPPQQTSILDGDAPLAMDATRPTLPRLLQSAGYRTALIGKWHLGLGDGRTPVDFNGEIRPGPLEVGFDEAFFIPATVDRVPCVFIEDHHVFGLDSTDPIGVSYLRRIGIDPVGHEHPEVLKFPADRQHADTIINGISRIGHMNGGHAAQWVDEDIADTITRRSIAFIERNRDRPFFLSLGTHDPHVPRAPHPRFRGKSRMGVRGDAIAEIDWCVGEVLAALERLHLTNNTLVLFTSDNGPVLFDGYFDGAAEAVGNHKPGGGLRGWKYLQFEAGTRVPLIASWPGHVRPGRTDQYFSLVDLFATTAALTGGRLQAGAAPDSLDLHEILLGTTGMQLRDHVVQHGIGGALAIRQGDWKYISACTSAGGIGRGADPHDKRFDEARVTEPLLFNLRTDPAETTNVIQKYPAEGKRLAALLESIRAQRAPDAKR